MTSATAEAASLLGTLFGSPWIAAGVVALVTAAAQASLGMGFGLVAAPLLALVDPRLAPAPVLYLGMVVAGLGAWRERVRVAWPEVGWALVGRAFGAAAAAALVAQVADRESFGGVFGATLAFAVLISLLGPPLRFGRPALLGAATASGFMGTITSVGAPPMALVYQSRPAETARPTLSAFFAIGCVFSLVGLHLSGWADLRDPIAAALMAPGLVLGIALGRRIEGAAARRWRPALLGLVGAASLTLVWRALA